MDYQPSSGRELNDTIVAIATATGTGAVGIVRVSGPDLRAVTTALCPVPLVPRQATLHTLRTAQGEALDQVLLLYFPAPNSFTGEDMLEIQAHGGAVVLQLVLAHVLEVGRSLPALRVRLAQPGEFTQRAFLNDKLDLLQAEAIASLIHARTTTAARSAMRTLQGDFSAQIAAFQMQLMHVRCLVEAGIDFPEEDLDLRYLEDLQARLDDLLQALASTLRAAQTGRILSEGLRVVLVGLPNVGKSALLNALVGDDAAIVSPIAGTTRDRIEVSTQLHGVAVVLVDTAGLHESTDPIELLGMQRTRDALQQADVVLWLRDLTQRGEAAAASQEAHIANLLQGQGLTPVELWNKVDCVTDAALAPSLSFSATHKTGLEAVTDAILCAGGVDLQQAETGVYMANQRHQQALLNVQQQLQRALSTLGLADRVGLALDAHSHHEAAPTLSFVQWDVLAEYLRLAQGALDAITGKHDVEDVLAQIFSQFCIGK